MSALINENPLFQPVHYAGQIYFTSQYFHQQYQANKSVGGKYSQLQHFNRLIRNIETYPDYVVRRDIVELTKESEAGPDFGPVFKASYGKPIMLINATAQVALTHHLDDEVSKLISIGVNAKTAQDGSALAPPASPRDYIAANEVFTSNLSVAKLIFDGNQAILSANRATVKTTGVDILSNLGATELIADTKEVLLTSTDIGKQLGLSAQKVNKLLEDAGLQQHLQCAKNKKIWDLTAAGAKYAEVLDTGKKEGNGTPIKQIKWYSSVVGLIAPGNG